jgi:hypothetical protein
VFEAMLRWFRHIKFCGKGEYPSGRSDHDERAMDAE